MVNVAGTDQERGTHSSSSCGEREETAGYGTHHQGAGCCGNFRKGSEGRTGLRGGNEELSLIGRKN